MSHPSEAAATPPALELRGVSKAYHGAGGRPRYALRQIDLSLPAGSTLALSGRSGSGKSTLLNLAAATDLPSEGEILVRGRDLSCLSEHERTLYRRDGVGMVFQFFYLLSHLSVLDNVGLPELIAGGRREDFEPRALELLSRVGLAERAADSVEKLSGGESQRVAICRALLRRPPLILADEPTGNLDDESGRQVMALMLELVAAEGATLVYATHSSELAELAHRRVRLVSGRLEQA
jgi:ABC-type lipoprotein export system ATPase subunit